MNLGDPELELIDPTPNVHLLFVQFDKLFFTSTLSNRVVVRWSKRMYSCAGICSYEGRSGYCNIALSEPLLKLRPRKDLVETLLHEMIHAYLFVTNNDRDRDGHGPVFQAHMHRINRCAGLKISVYHNFVNEVKLYQIHVWRCNGPCQSRKPFFGIVRRSVNRAPGPNDFWWSTHKAQCGGTFIKIKEPNKPAQKTVPKSNVITNYIPSNTVKIKVPKKGVTAKPILKDSNHNIKSNRNNANVVNGNGHFSPILINGKPMSDGKGQIIDGYRKRSNSSDVVETVRNVWGKKEIINIQGILTNSKSSDVVETVRNVWTKKKIITQRKGVLSSNPDLNRNKSDVCFIENTPANTKIVDFFKSPAPSVSKDVCEKDIKINQTVPRRITTNVTSGFSNTDQNITFNKNADAIINKDYSFSTLNNPKSIPNVQREIITSKRNRSNSTDVGETVRKAWGSKEMAGTQTNVIVNSPNINPNKHQLETNFIQNTPAKIKKIDDYFKSTAADVLKDVYGKDIQVTQSSNGKKLVAVNDANYVSCPVCNIKVKNDDINIHLDKCLIDVNKCNKDNAATVSNEINGRLSEQKVSRAIPQLSTLNKATNFKLNNEDIKIEIPDSWSSSFVNELFNNTRVCSSVHSKPFKPASNIQSAAKNNDFTVDCKKYDKGNTQLVVKKIDLNSDIKKSSKFDIQSVVQKIDVSTDIKKPESIIQIDKKINKSTETNFPFMTQPGTSKGSLESIEICGWCKMKLGLMSVEEHLEDCVAFEEVLSTCADEKEQELIANGTIVIDDDDIFDETLTLNATGTKSPCPCCFKMIEQAEMNAHLDICLT